jgi:hypothetical protein
MSGQRRNPPSAAEIRRLLASRKLDRVVILGANGTMGYGSRRAVHPGGPGSDLPGAHQGEGGGGARRGDPPGALAHGGLAREGRRLRSRFRKAVAGADLIFEALTEDFDVKKEMFDRVEEARRDDSIVATVTSGPVDQRAVQGPRRVVPQELPWLHFFNPPNVIVGTELIAGRDTDPAVVTTSRRSRARGSAARSCARTTRPRSRATASASRC